MIIKKSDMVKALNFVKPAVSYNEIIAGSKNFIFDSSFVSAYNDSICISYPFPFETPFSANADDILNTVKTVREKEFDMTVESAVVTIKSKSTTATLAAMPIEEQQVWEMIESLNLKEAEFQELPKGFSTALNLSRFSAARNITADNAHCVLVKDNQIFATDQCRCNRYDLEQGLGLTFLLPAKSIAELKHFDIAHINLQNGWVHFMSEDETIFSSRVVSGDFPEIESLLAEYDDAKGFIMFPAPEEVRDVVQDISFMTDENYIEEKFVSVSVLNEDDKIKIVCRAEKETGNIEQVIYVDSDKPLKKEMSFLINPKFFADILEKTAKVKIDSDKAIFKMKGFTHIVGLVVEEGE